MKAVYIFGESHAESLGWGSNEFHRKDLEFNFLRVKAKTAWNLHYEIEQIQEFEPLKDITYMPALGEVDIRFHLFAKKNTEEVVRNYVSRSVEYFQDKKLRFLAPVPPSNMKLYDNEYKGSNEERYQIFEEFLFFLNKYSEDYGLDSPIDVREAVGLNHFPDHYYREDGYHLALEPQLMILNYLCDKIGA